MKNINIEIIKIFYCPYYQLQTSIKIAGVNQK
jgi:hypothetical protein